MNRQDIISICEEKSTIPLFKLEVDAFMYPAPTKKEKEWIDVYFESSEWDKLNPEKFKKDIINYIISIYKNEYILDFKCLNSSCDIFLPDLKVGFKLLGLFEYSEINVNKKHQSNTWNDFENSGYHIIQIFEDSWNLKEDIIKNRIVNILGLSKKIYARICETRIITDNSIIKDFINASHIQGTIGSSIKIGLYYENELVSIMTFGSLRKNLGQVGMVNSYELLRFCNKHGVNVVGGASKLFKYFIKQYNPNTIISYADKCWSSRECLYKKIGMKSVHDSSPSYFYIVGTRRKGRFGYRKDVVLQVGFDGNFVGEHTGMLSMNIFRIFDCGTIKYCWTKDE